MSDWESDDADPFVPIWEGPTPQAERIRAQIEAAHIPVEWGDPLNPGEARVQVPHSYLEEVRGVLSGEKTAWPTMTAYTEDGFDWKPSVRLAFIAMALAVLLVILLTVAG